MFRGGTIHRLGQSKFEGKGDVIGGVTAVSEKERDAALGCGRRRCRQSAVGVEAPAREVGFSSSRARE